MNYIYLFIAFLLIAVLFFALAWQKQKNISDENFKRSQQWAADFNRKCEEYNELLSDARKVDEERNHLKIQNTVLKTKIKRISK